MKFTFFNGNVVFDEASSWWSSQEVLLPDSQEIEEKLQEKNYRSNRRLRVRNLQKKADALRNVQKPKAHGNKKRCATITSGEGKFEQAYRRRRRRRTGSVTNVLLLWARGKQPASLPQLLKEQDEIMLLWNVFWRGLGMKPISFYLKQCDAFNSTSIRWPE